MKFTEKQPNIYIFQRFLAKTRDSLGLVNVPIWMAQTKETNLNQQKPRRGVGGTAIYGLYPGGYCHIWAIQVCAAVKGMVFKQFTLGQGDQSVWVQNRVSFLRKLIGWLKVLSRLGKQQTATLGQGGFGEFTLVQGSKIQLNQLWYRLRVPGSQWHIPTQKFLKNLLGGLYKYVPL